MYLDLLSKFPTAQINADILNSAFVVGAGETTKLNQFGEFANSSWSNAEDGSLVLNADNINNVNRDTLTNVAKTIAPLLSSNNDNVVEIRCQFATNPGVEDFGVIVKYVTDAYKVVPVDVDYVEGTPIAIS